MFKNKSCLASLKTTVKLSKLGFDFEVFLYFYSTKCFKGVVPGYYPNIKHTTGEGRKEKKKGKQEGVGGKLLDSKECYMTERAKSFPVCTERKKIKSLAHILIPVPQKGLPSPE